MAGKPNTQLAKPKYDLATLPGEFSPVGYHMPENLNHDKWREVGEKLAGIQGAVMWWVGDWLAFGAEREWGKTYDEAIELFGYEYDTLVKATSTSRSVELSRRLLNLSWQHHFEVKKLSPTEQTKWLKRAESKGWKSKQLRVYIREADDAVCPTEFIDCKPLGSLPEDHFGCIYADPPWPYENQATRASTSNHYPTMTLDAICSLPAGQRALAKSHLWLWTTNGFLREAFTVIEAWGFAHSSVMVWVKPQMGMGNYVRVCHEFLMIATRGALAGRSGDQRSVIEHDRMEHSQKPEEFRTVIEAVSPGPYLELFGRKEVPGWTVWGNQIKRTPC